ncbi:uncharacterized protein KY384_008602 [Bacidia gigantensis]|uniref:uncharacterized protein n=1 Tax=Bacidia gigantensis TaxID=2732470 RepID=UPI001D03E5A4|nr:uncharacterized protein KY384_008602 [Bacidia gigantensis]KAG8527172.1 hypothetical protein KY384_008602 [Bacidia gigantensis]
MGLTKSRRMQIMLVIDAIFFVWQRAETIGALFNGIFLLALCVTIFLDAIQRFVEPQQVQRPLLVLIVGCIGLVANIGGMYLFHDHGHGHGHTHEEGSSHTHGSDPLATAEEGQHTKAVGGRTKVISDESGNVADVLPQSIVGGWPKSDSLKQASKESTSSAKDRKSKDFGSNDEEDSTLAPDQSSSPISLPNSSPSKRRHTRSGSRSMFASVDDIHPHPASFRKEIIAAAGRFDEETSSGSSACKVDGEHDAAENTPLLGQTQSNGSAKKSRKGPSWLRNSDEAHEGHHHCKSRDKPDGHGHSHSDLNMRGVLLHVIGDALGNVGVIISALIIWLSSGSWRFYSDPVMSLIITAIILTSAIPLCKATTRILLQAVPSHINVDEIKEDIEDLEGIVNCHHLHVWQLSDVKVVASVHVLVDFDFEEGGKARYMKLARAVRRCLHEFGIHSSTIQTEFDIKKSHRHTPATEQDGAISGNGHAEPGQSSKKGSRVPSLATPLTNLLWYCAIATPRWISTLLFSLPTHITSTSVAKHHLRQSMMGDAPVRTEELLILIPGKEPTTVTARIRNEHPHIKVKFHELKSWSPNIADHDIDPSLFKTTTLLVIATFLPPPDWAPHLRLVHTLLAGVDRLVTHPLFTDTDIVFTSSSGVAAPQIAEWVLGYGSIGRQCARLAKAAGMRVVVFTARLRDSEEERMERGKWVVPGTGDWEGKIPDLWLSNASEGGLEGFLKEGLDWLVITLPLTPKTEGLVGKEELGVLSKEGGGRGAFVSNISRGKILDQKALVEGLKKWEGSVGKEGLRGAALDVADPEPLPEGDELWVAPNCLISPHVSGEAKGYVGGAMAVFEENLRREDRGRRC